MTQTTPAHLEYVLRLGDAALIHGQRLSEWCGHAPVLEEDLALANMALDFVGQARMLLSHAGTLEGKGRDEDTLAFLRHEGQYRNPTLCEMPNTDFAHTMIKGFLLSSFNLLMWSRLCGSSDKALAAIAAKSLKEARYHAEHTGDWVIRLGDGTEESHRRAQAALDILWPYTNELFAANPTDDAAAAAGVGPAWSELAEAWEAAVLPVLQQATLTVPARTPFQTYGKFGRHSEHLGHLLAVMQHLPRSFPGATW